MNQGPGGSFWRTAIQAVLVSQWLTMTTAQEPSRLPPANVQTSGPGPTAITFEDWLSQLPAQCTGSWQSSPLHSSADPVCLPKRDRSSTGNSGLPADAPSNAFGNQPQRLAAYRAQVEAIRAPEPEADQTEELPTPNADAARPQRLAKPTPAESDELLLDEPPQDSLLLDPDALQTAPTPASPAPPPVDQAATPSNAPQGNASQADAPQADDLLGEGMPSDALLDGEMPSEDTSSDDLLDGDSQSKDSLSDETTAVPTELSDDPLSGMGPKEGDRAKAPASSTDGTPGSVSTAPVHPLEQVYPSAQTCAKCHPLHYDQWRMSGHAYASVSPMFQRFEQAMQDLTEGTVGAFCMRCHAPIATQLGIPGSATLLDAAPVVREGITCVVCHRIKEAVGRTNGDRRVEPGDIHAPIYGSTSGAGVRDAISKAEELKLKLSPDDKRPGQPMHQHCGPFEPVTRSDFCASCHQVAVHPGIGLEIVHAQYRSGPAHARGVTCQECHMGSVPGKAMGYELAHIAEVANKKFGEPRKQSNHIFWGPGYSIAHPGLFPHNPDAQKYSPRQWLTFEYRAGWGTESFEQSVAPECRFPAPWDNKDERIDARKIIDANLKKLDEKRAFATLTMSAGGKVEGPFFGSKPAVHAPLRFQYRVSNISDGHNLPTGSLGAQPQLWLNVALVNPAGTRVWETGYLDSNGDLADLQSEDVHHVRLPVDSQLFNLQTKFLINNIRGTDREAPVPLNFSLDQLVFLRPGAVPVSVLNHPPLIRMEAHSIPPLDHRMAKYVIPSTVMNQPGLYRLSVRLRSRPEPPYFMRLVGASPEMIRRLNENIIDFEVQSHTFEVEETPSIAMPKRLFLR